MHLPSLLVPCLEEGCTRRTTEPAGVAPCRGRGQRSTNPSPRMGHQGRRWRGSNPHAGTRGGASQTGALLVHPGSQGATRATGPPPLQSCVKREVRPRQASHHRPPSPLSARGRHAAHTNPTRRRANDGHHLRDHQRDRGMHQRLRRIHFVEAVMTPEIIIALSGLGGVLFGVVSGFGLKGTYARLRLAKLRLNAIWMRILIKCVPYEKGDEDKQVPQ